MLSPATSSNSFHRLAQTDIQGTLASIPSPDNDTYWVVSYAGIEDNKSQYQGNIHPRTPHTGSGIVDLFLKETIDQPLQPLVYHVLTVLTVPTHCA